MFIVVQSNVSHVHNTYWYIMHDLQYTHIHIHISNIIRSGPSRRPKERVSFRVIITSSEPCYRWFAKWKESCFGISRIHSSYSKYQAQELWQGSKQLVFKGFQGSKNKSTSYIDKNHLTDTLQGINISHLGKRKIIFKMPFLGDMLVPWRVSTPSHRKILFLSHPTYQRLPFGKLFRWRGWFDSTRLWGPRSVVREIQISPEKGRFFFFGIQQVQQYATHLFEKKHYHY